MPVITRLPPSYEEIDREKKKGEKNDIRIAEWSERESNSSLIRRNNSCYIVLHQLNNNNSSKEKKKRTTKVSLIVLVYT